LSDSTTLTVAGVPEDGELAPRAGGVMPRVGRGSRWFFFTVCLALVPIALSWLFLPRGSSFLSAVEHGEFAILAGAVSAGTLDITLGIKRRRWWTSLTTIAAIGVLLLSTVILAAVVGGAQQLSPATLVVISLWLLGVAVADGLVAVIAEMSEKR
jgi:hypothetical protein